MVVINKPTPNEEQKYVIKDQNTFKLMMDKIKAYINNKSAKPLKIVVDRKWLWLLLNELDNNCGIIPDMILTSASAKEYCVYFEGTRLDVYTEKTSKTIDDLSSLFSGFLWY